MGRTYIAKYRIQFESNVFLTDFSWNSQSYGRPTEKNLEKWRQSMNESFKLGGVNEHISKAAGILVHISKAWIVRQRDNVIMAKTSMPMFEAV